jgi:hypothetical protein
LDKTCLGIHIVDLLQHRVKALPGVFKEPLDDLRILDWGCPLA